MCICHLHLILAFIKNFAKKLIFAHFLVFQEFLLGPKHSPKARSKKVSPKSRRTAELYKSSHNIGNRTAAGWVGSYKESEYALVYPEGFWESVKPENGEVSPDHSPVREKDSKHAKDKPKDKDTKEKASKEKPSSPCRTGTKRKHSETESPSKPEKTKIKSEKTKSDKSSRTKSKSPQRPKSKSPQRGSKEAKSTSDNKKGSTDTKKDAKKTSKDKDDAKSAKKGNKSPRSPSPPKKTPAKDKDNKSGSSSKKSKKPTPSPVKPRAPRIKRTACLNANAINSLLYENDEPSPKKHKVEEEYDEVVTDDKTSIFAFNSDDSQSSLPDLSRGRKLTKETKTRDGSKDSAKGGKKAAKKGGKEVKKEVKKRVAKRCPSVDSSSEEESESESEKEDNTPLWPPPKRMASLNAQVCIYMTK